jgi:hypothetical protein
MLPPVASPAGTQSPLRACRRPQSRCRTPQSGTPACRARAPYLHGARCGAQGGRCVQRRPARHMPRRSPAGALVAGVVGWMGSSVWLSGGAVGENDASGVAVMAAMDDRNSAARGEWGEGVWSLWCVTRNTLLPPPPTLAPSVARTQQVAVDVGGGQRKHGSDPRRLHGDVQRAAAARQWLGRQLRDPSTRQRHAGDACTLSRPQPHPPSSPAHPAGSLTATPWYAS